MDIEKQANSPSKDSQAINGQVVDKEALKQVIDDALKTVPKLENKETYIKQILSDDILEQHQGVIALRLLFEKHEEDQDTFNSDSIKRFIEFIQSKDQPQLRSQTCQLLGFYLNNQASVDKFVEAGGIEPLIELLDAENDFFAQKALIIVGNIANEGETYRDLFFEKKGILDTICGLIKQSKATSIHQSGTWALACLCQKRSEYNEEDYVNALDCFFEFTKTSKNMEVILSCLQGLQQFTRSQDLEDRWFSKSFIDPLSNKLLSSNKEIIVPTLKILCDLSADDKASELLKSKDLIGNITALLDHEAMEVQKFSIITAANLACDDGKINEQIVTQAKFSEKIKHILSPSKGSMVDEKVQIEALYLLSNAAQNITPKSLEIFVPNLIELLYKGFVLSDPKKILPNVLKGLDTICELSQNNKKQFTEVLVRIEDGGILEKIYELQYQSKDDDIIVLADKIIYTYFHPK